MTSCEDHPVLVVLLSSNGAIRQGESR